MCCICIFGHISQAGSYVDDKVLRFDFSHFEKISAELLKEIEEKVNQIVFEGRPVVIKNMTKEEALKKVDNIINEKLTSDITLKYNDYETIVNNSQFGIQFDNQKAISNAYNVGKENNIVVNNYKILFAKLHKINIEPELIINSETLQNKIREISAKLPNAVVENSYYIEGNKLIIVKGKRRK